MGEPATIVLWSGLLIGVAFGVVALLSGFCMLSGLRGWWIEADGRKIRTVAVAAAVAIVATQGLALAGLVDLGKSIYLQPTFSPALIAFGGLLFGYGMVLANACASRALVLLARGNLRSLLVVVIIAITAEATLKGLIAPARLTFLNWTAIAPPAVSLADLFADAGLAGHWSTIFAVLLLSGALLTFALTHDHFRRSPWQIFAGVAVGLLVAGGWFVTGYLGADDFNPVPVASLSFVAPVADTVQYVMFSTGLPLNFGIVLTVGVLIGSFGASLATRSFHLEGFSSPQHMLRSATGAVLMGCGGALAYGCTVGQGLSGVSTLALPSLLAVAGIVAGAWVGLHGPLRAYLPQAPRAQANAAN